MADCWLENEEFNFDMPLSPLSAGKCDASTSKSAFTDNDYDDEVFFGPVGHMERCAAVVARKEKVDPLMPLEPAEQALLLQESAKLSSMLKLRPLVSIQNNSPRSIVYPFKRDSSGIDIRKLSLVRERLSSRENKENIGHEDNRVGIIDCKTEAKSSESKEDNRNNEGKNSRDDSKEEKLSKLKQPTISKNVTHHRSFTGTDEKKLQLKTTSMPLSSNIPKIQSKIARPSSIPSLKPGLLKVQPRVRGTSVQESKLKPLKALKSDSISVFESRTDVPAKSTLKSKPFVTPKKSGEAKHVRSKTGEIQTRRRSTDLSSSISRLQFSRPNHNSTPKQQPLKHGSSSRRSIGSAAGSTKTAPNSAGTPLKVHSGKSVSSVNREKGRDTPSSKSSTLRRSLVTKPNLDKTETSPRTKSAQRRGSLLKYPNAKTSPEKRKTYSGNTSMVRSSTSVANSQNPRPKDNASLLDIETIAPVSDPDTNVVISCPTADGNIPAWDAQGASQDHPLLETLNDNLHRIHQSDILVPEISATHASPLLKFDSPLPDNAISDPFATGNTPPSLPVSDGVLAPVQMEANLIQF